MPEHLMMHTTDDNVVIMEGARVIGSVSFGAECGVWFNAVLRGDFGSILVGSYTNIQDNVVIHCRDGAEVRLGDYVSIGHGAILHGCAVEDNSLIGMGAIVMDGAVVGKNCLVAAGALIPGGTVIPDGSLVMGVPGVVKRPLTQREIDFNRANAEKYAKRKEMYR